MSDISNQLIKDSYNYVLQSDISTGIVYRIGGVIPVNPIFLSGLTINSTFTFADGSESNGYVLTSDASGNATWKPVTAATPSTGVTSINTGTGLSADSTTGAVTIINTSPDQTVTISGGTNIQITGTYPDFGINYTGQTSFPYLALSGGTVTGRTIFQSGLTANTISATTYQNLPSQSGTGISAFSYNQSTGLLTITKNDTTTLTAGTFSYVTATTLSSANVLSVTSNGGSGVTTTINAVTGGTYSNGTITLSGTGSVNGTQITGLSALTPTTLYSGNGTLLSNRVVNLSSYTLNFSSTTNPNTLVMSGGNVGIGTSTPTFILDVANNVRIQKSDFPVVTIQNTSTGYPILKFKNSTYNSVSVGDTTAYISLTNNSDTLQGSITFNKSVSGTSNLVLNGDSNVNNNVLIGSNVDNGYKLNVAGTTRIQDKLTVSATTDPVKFIGLQSSSDTNILTVDGTGVVHTSPISGLTTGLTTTNIYNSNGTLTGNRIVGLSSYTLNFSSATNPNTLVLSGGNLGIGTSSPSVKLDVYGNDSTKNTAQFGTIGIQSYTTNNAWFGDNVYFNGTQFIRRNSGYSGLFYFAGNEGQFRFGDNGLSGTPVTNGYSTFGTISLKTNLDGTFAVGNMWYASGDYTGAKFIVNSSGNAGVGTISPSNRLHVYSVSDPLKLEGVQTSTDTELLTIDGSGVVHKISTSAITSGITVTGSFLRNKTHSGATDTIQINESIFNPADLTVLSTSVFIVDTDADYYILGDLYNYGSIIVNGTLKVGGIIYNYGTITGPGIIE